MAPSATAPLATSRKSPCKPPPPHATPLAPPSRSMRVRGQSSHTLFKTDDLYPGRRNHSDAASRRGMITVGSHRRSACMQQPAPSVTTLRLPARYVQALFAWSAASGTSQRPRWRKHAMWQQVHTAQHSGTAYCSAPLGSSTAVTTDSDSCTAAATHATWFRGSGRLVPAPQ